MTRIPQQGSTLIGPDGTVRVQDLVVPLSRYLSDEARQAAIEQARNPPPYLFDGDPAVYRARMDKEFYAPRLELARKRHAVNVCEKTIGGVRTDEVVPVEGISPRNRHRVLICLHGGGFRIGAGMGALLESVPVASLGKIRVIAVDYRQGPEHEFPAASEDVAAVYREQLEHTPAENIGIYGNSAGAVLTAMVTAWFQKEGLPRPGAIALLSGPADDIWGGDARYTTMGFIGFPAPPVHPNPPDTGMPYVKKEDLQDPYVSPAFAQEILSRFPSSLVITSTRDGAMSSAVYSHSRLIAAGINADLHIWEALGHGFVFDRDIPEAREALGVMTRFFDRHLGTGTP
jgi:acetyl esterase/lipase